MAEQSTNPGLLAQAGVSPTQGDDLADLSPEELQIYQTLMNQVSRIVFDEKVFQTILTQIQEGTKTQTPFLGLATVVANALLKIKMDSIKAKFDIPDKLLLKACAELVGDLASIAVENKVFQFTQEMVDGAYLRAVDMLREGMQQAGMIDQNKYKQDLQNMIAADKEGMLNNILPGMNRHQRRAMQAGGKRL